ncbi:hypothetical protein M565_ctg3P023 [Vibrio cyclitrophicus FF75]|nr:hypothetical protein M565_ctg3P023 [Vibrio cyclitrophicus FF75]
MGFTVSQLSSINISTSTWILQLSEAITKQYNQRKHKRSYRYYAMSFTLNTRLNR